MTPSGVPTYSVTDALPPLNWLIAVSIAAAFGPVGSMVVTTRSDVLDIADMPPHISAVQRPEGEGLAIVPDMSLDDVEKVVIQRTLERTKGNREEAARILKIGERTLYRKLDKYGLK